MNGRRRALARERICQMVRYVRGRPRAAVRALREHVTWRAAAAFVRAHTVLMIAAAAALVTSFVVPPDAQWRGYFDWRTLTCLFCVLAVVRALHNISFFYILAHRLVRVFGNARMCILALVVVTFVGSMLIANDMALITFLPLGFFVLHSTGMEKHAPITFIMQNIAANLGGMLTPFGNPQNLYLYSRFSIPTDEFMGIMLLPFLAAVTMIVIICLRIPAEPMQVGADSHARLNVPRLAVYLTLFVLSIAIVFRSVPYWLGLAIIPPVLTVMDRNALKTVDYPLLGTFFCFFIFAGNMSRIEPVRAFFSTLMARSPLLFGALSCQVISNVPSAILLSQFTDRYAALLRAVNIGGTGTLVASLASLITYAEFSRHYPERRRAYLTMFTGYNALFLVVLLALCAFFPV